MLCQGLWVPASGVKKQCNLSSSKLCWFVSVLFIWEQNFGEQGSAFKAYSPVKVQLAIQSIWTTFLNKFLVGQVVVARIKKQSGSEIAVSILSVWAITLLLTLISPGYFPLGGVDVSNKKATAIDLCAASVHLHLMGNHLVSSSSDSCEWILALTIVKIPSENRVGKYSKMVLINNFEKWYPFFYFES